MSHDGRPGFTEDDYAIARRIFAEQISATVNEDDNYAAIKAGFYTEVEKAVGRGSFVVPVETLAAAVLWADVNTRAASTTRRMFDDLAKGQTSLPLDDWLDQPMTVGQLRRILVRHYTPADGQKMLDARRDHAKRADMRYKKMQEQVQHLDRLVNAHGTLPEAFHAGAVVLGMVSH